MTAISIGDAIVGEKDGFAEFLVTLDAPSKRKVSFSINSYAGSAGYSDFVEKDVDLFFRPGETQKIVRIALSDDTSRERAESFYLALENVTNATVAREVGTATIIDNDAPAGTPVVRIEHRVVDEAAGTITFAVILDRPGTGTVKIDYATSNGTANAGADYAAAAGTLTFQRGETVKHITIALADDTATEKDESFAITLSNLRGAVSYDPVAEVTIAANDAKRSALPTLSVGDAIVGEKDGFVDFVVRLDAPSKAPITVRYNNYAGDAGYSDFEENDGFLTFAPGETVKTVRVAVIDDTTREAREPFYLQLSAAEGAEITRDIATATIVDNDAPSGTPLVTVENLVVDEKAGEAVLTIVLDRPSTGVVSLDYATRAGTAAEGSDFTALAGSLRFGPGETVRTIRVPITDDTAREALERFEVAISNVKGATVLDDTGQITIGANDARLSSLPGLFVDDAIVGEGGAYVDVIVRLDAPATERVTVSYNSYAGLAGYSDFDENDGFLTFAAGETIKTIRIPIYEDTSRERVERFFVELSDPANASIVKDTATILLYDNDAPSGTPVVSIQDVIVDEQAGEVTFVLALDRPSTGVVSLDYATVDGDARAGVDYRANGGSLNFAAGETVKIVTVAIVDDGAAELDERFSLLLSNIKGATTLDASATAIIAANDATASNLPYLTIEDATAGERDGFLTFVVRLDAPATESVRVAYNNYAYSAGYSDFSETDGQLTFLPGETVKTILVPILDDSSVEERETFFVSLVDATGATVARYYAAGTIIDNDASAGAPTIAVRDVSVDEASRQVTFVVTLDRPSAGIVSLDYATAADSAKAGKDFSAAAGTLTFAAGETAKSVTVVLADDGIAENDESFRLVLSNFTGAQAGDSSATATIGANDGTPQSAPSLTISAPAQVAEGGDYVEVVIRLSAPSNSAVTVDYNSYSGTAGYSDFNEADGSLLFRPGETLKIVQIEIEDDTGKEGSETFYIRLEDAVGATIGGTPAAVTILDNEPASSPVDWPALIQAAGMHGMWPQPGSELLLLV